MLQWVEPTESDSNIFACKNKFQFKTTITTLLPRLYIRWRRREKLNVFQLLNMKANKPKAVQRPHFFTFCTNMVKLVHIIYQTSVCT